MELREVFKSFKDAVCTALLKEDPTAIMKTDEWTHAEKGGGETTIIKGDVYDRAAIAFSHVGGTLEKEFAKQFSTGIPPEEVTALPFEAMGTSLIIHPHSPMVPTCHANFRWLSVGNQSWVGGGADLTPMVLFEEDAVHFHQTFKNGCDSFNKEFYPKFKKWCDEYFYLPHRGEARGVGGIFYDYLGRDDGTASQYFDFQKKISSSFIDAYLPLVAKRKELPFSPEQKQFQLIRRGRYVEFNLLYDRGTLFGLKSGGRTESILMSLPPDVKWEYCYTPTTEQEKLISVLKNPREWI